MMRSLTVLLACLAAAPAAAQGISQPTPPPIVTAENDAWYRQRQPVPFSGDTYYPAGATVFFNGNTMVRCGHYNGVPLYMDATIEPYSAILVPIGGGMLQPYERMRRGELAGTSGCRTPSFPARTARVANVIPMAAGAPVATGPLDVMRSGEPGAVGTTGRVSMRTPASLSPAPPTAVPVGTGGVAVVRSQVAGGLLTARRPQGNDGVWVQFMGERWISAGPVVPLRGSDFVEVGEYNGFPVYARKGLQEDRIYLPSAGGVVPFRLKE